MKKILLIICLASMLTLAFGAGPEYAAYYSDRFLICLQPDVVIQEIDSKNRNPVTGIESLDQLLALRDVAGMEMYAVGATPDDMDGDIILSNIFRLSFDQDRRDLSQIIDEFSKDSHILYAEKEAINRVYYFPNDPRYGQQWFLQRVEANDAWDLWDIAGGNEPGDRNIVLASVDTGVQYIHPDLWQSAWINQAEIPTDIFETVDTDSNGYVNAEEVVAFLDDYNSDGTTNLRDAVHTSSPFTNGVDDDDWDGNSTTFIDDLVGWDPQGVTNGNDPDNDPHAILGDHGTHVAGLLAATTDNSVGISSVTFNGSIMSVKCQYDQGDQDLVYDGYSGMLYAAKAGADIINLSWGGSGGGASAQAIVNLCYNTYGAIVVAAAGNDASSELHYPSAFDNVVSVAATSAGDGLASFSNYGSTIDICSPGENIHSTVFNGSYQSWPGTSMASPIVGSCFGLLMSVNPERDNDWLVQTLLEAADPIDDINPSHVGDLGSGRVNIYNALAQSLFPLLSFDSYSLQMIVDNGDGQLSPGEEARMRVNLFNDPGWLTALGVTAVLSTSSEYVNISDATGDYGDIFPGNVAPNIIDRYQFSIVEGAPSGMYPFSLEVTANTESDHPYTVIIEFEVEASIWQANFPLSTAEIIGGNATVDIDGDGDMEIIFGSSDSMLHVIQEDGTELAGFPMVAGHKFEASPAIGDIDNDGDLEIVIGAKDDNLYVIQHDGSSQIVYTSGSYILAPASLYDLDADGDLEIIIPCFDDELAIVHHDGVAFEGFPLILEDHMTNGVAIGDVDADGNINIVVGTWGDRVHALNLDGTEAPGFPIEMTDKVRSAPLLANIDASADGSLEIIFGCDDNNFYAFDNTGNELWNVVAGGQNVQSDPSAADMDGDGDLEIFFGGLDRNIYALDHTGSILEGWPVFTGGAIYSSPALADVNGDGLAEIFVGSNDFMLYGLNLDGSALGGFPAQSSDKIEGSPSIAYFDGDEDVEIIVGSADALLVIDLSTSGEIASYWPTHRGNLQRTGATPILVSINERAGLPDEYVLASNYPNPFNPSTQISFAIPEAGRVSIQVLDIRGRILETLISEHLNPASYSVTWNGDIGGKPASAGIYLYRLSTPNANMVRKMILLK
ncbi:S8 family serine peptidase [bacterium]|nr:S8 family serine peptidase [bacterium]